MPHLLGSRKFVKVKARMIKLLVGEVISICSAVLTRYRTERIIAINLLSVHRVITMHSAFGVATSQQIRKTDSMPCFEECINIDSLVIPTILTQCCLT